MARRSNSFGPVLGYHGCDRSVAESVLAGSAELKPSENSYDWLGPGVYFWVDSPQRAIEWALKAKRAGRINEAYVVGAHINLGLCLNFTDYGVMGEVKNAFKLLKSLADTISLPLPKNEVVDDTIYLKRSLDCQVIQFVHRIRQDIGEVPYDSVLGVFEEGERVYRGSGIREYTHMQVAVRLTDIITGYFRVRGLDIPAGDRRYSHEQQ